MNRYATILADPPWSYDQSRVNGAAEKHYAVMSVDDICALPVADVATRDAVLILWATWPLLPDALRVLGAWGFTYKSGFPWIKITEAPCITLWGAIEVKPHYGNGWWARGCSEAVLIGIRGDVRAPANNFMGLLSDNYQHSRKPANIYDYAETLSGPYLELFARRERPGWTCLGNEIDGLDIRDALAHLAEVGKEVSV